MSGIDDIIDRATRELNEHVIREVQSSGSTMWPEPSPVTTCHPLPHTVCLAYCGKTIGWRACFFKETGEYMFENRDIAHLVTHWIPAPPEPPKV